MNTFVKIFASIAVLCIGAYALAICLLGLVAFIGKKAEDDE